MKWELATDEQLVTIAKYDNDLPHSLLGEVVEEMLNRGLFDRIIRDCINVVIKNTQRMERIYQVSVEDFLQIGRIEVLSALKSFKRDKGMNFISFVFLKVRSQLGKEIVFLESKKRDHRVCMSYNNETDEGTEMIEFLPSKVNVENYVVNKVTFEQLLKRANKHQQRVVLLRMQGYKFAEIAHLLKRGTGKSMQQAYRIAQDKMRKGA
ncbi:hypothetical protein ACFYKX_26475 [Cytobacillus sp. FJAT-54145]|uniref:Uncharacterized protein n=1 Tax=Cytobacillus spartinae TaxID=3299023 RepID=A0ABW6KMQ8_9BACI